MDYSIISHSKLKVFGLSNPLREENSFLKGFCMDIRELQDVDLIK